MNKHTVHSIITLSRSCWCARAGHQMSLCVEHMACCLFGAMCSHVDCLPPPVLLTNHCFSGSTCVSLITLVCLHILVSWCRQSCADPLSFIQCVMFDCVTVACLPFPFGEVFVHFIIKTPISPALKSSFHFSPHAAMTLSVFTLAGLHMTFTESIFTLSEFVNEILRDFRMKLKFSHHHNRFIIIRLKFLLQQMKLVNTHRNSHLSVYL